MIGDLNFINLQLYQKQSPMKKTLLFLVANLTLLSCTSKDDSGNTTDPIIGTWETSGSSDEFFDEEETIAVEINFELSLTFNADGTGNQKASFWTPFEGEEFLESETLNFTWKNIASNPNFDSINQTYGLTFIEDGESDTSVLTFTYSADFKSVTTTDEDGGIVEWTKK